MNIVSRQIVIGVFIAAALMLGANASPSSRSDAPLQSALAMGTQLTLSNLGVGANLTGVLQSCRDKVLDVALDTVGEIAARLKQM